MAWLDLDDFTFLPTRTSADKYSAADMNSVDDNLTQLRDDLALILGANTQPTRDLATLESDLATAEGEIDTLQTDVSTIGIPYTKTGLELSNAADTEHDITIAVGRCSSSNLDTVLVLSSPLTKQIDASWSAGTNAGGLDTGAVGSSAWYYIWLIKKDSDGSIDAIFSLSATSPTMPAGYTYNRRIGAVITDGSSNILQFLQIKNYFYLKTAVQSYSNTNPGTNAVLVTIKSPPSMLAIIDFAFGNAYSTDCYTLCTGPGETDTAPSVSLFDGRCSDVSVFACFQKTLLIDSSSRCRFRLSYSNTNTSVRVNSRGWIDTGI